MINYATNPDNFKTRLDQKLIFPRKFSRSRGSIQNSTLNKTSFLGSPVTQFLTTSKQDKKEVEKNT